MKRKIFVTAVLVCLVFLGLVGCKTDPDVMDAMNSTLSSPQIKDTVRVSLEKFNIYNTNTETGDTQVFLTWNIEYNLPHGYFDCSFEAHWGDDTIEGFGFLNEGTFEWSHSFSGEGPFKVYFIAERTRGEGGMCKIDPPVICWSGEVDLVSKTVVVSEN